MRPSEHLMTSLAADLDTIDGSLLVVADEGGRALLLERRAVLEAAAEDLRSGIAGPAALWAAREYLGAFRDGGRRHDRGVG